MRSRIALQRFARRQTFRSLLTRIRAQEPDLTADTDEALLLAFMERSLDQLLLAEDAFAELPEGTGGTATDASPLMWDALTFTARLPVAVYALNGMKAEVRLEEAENEVDELLNEVEQMKADLDQARGLIDQYRSRELHLQQLLDEAGIDVEIIDRMSTDIASRSIELDNRLN
jgi:hypothetical protein